MTKLALLSSGLIAAAIIAAPAMARDHHHAAARQTTSDPAVATDAYPGYFMGNTYAGPRGAYACAPAPRVGAFATEPWTSEAPCQPFAGY